MASKKPNPNEDFSREQLAVIVSQFADHVKECGQIRIELKTAISDLNKIIYRGGIVCLCALFYIVYEILHAKGEL